MPKQLCNRGAFVVFWYGVNKRMRHKTGKVPFTSGARFRFSDFCIIILCLSGAAYSLNLFRLDLFQTIDQQNEMPVGTIVIKNNTVQRRILNRVLWDRLAIESLVYRGDLIRVAELSAATLHIKGNSIDLDENTLIRIQDDPAGGDAFRIEMDEGNLSLNSGEGSGSIILNLMGSEIEAGPGTVLNVVAGKDGMVLQVSEGSAQFIEGGRKREIASGSMLSMDADGTEQRKPAAVVTQPRPNGRYLKNSPAPLSIGFAWNRINLDAADAVRLEFAGDRNFNRITQVMDNLDNAAQVSLNAGSWYWRLCYRDNVLSSGRLTVADAVISHLISPAKDSVFRFQDEPPALRFQWPEIDGASHYILEIGGPDFTNLRVSMELSAASCMQSGLGPGTWYWRVMPVFPSMYDGSAAFSPVSSFRLEQSDQPIMSEEDSVVLPEPEPVPEPQHEAAASFEQEREPEPEPESEPEPEQPPPPPVPVKLRLLAPAQNTRLPGLTAARGPVEFRWSSDGEVTRSRFILSRNRNPLRGRPSVEIVNPGRTVRLNQLDEGIWYWTVEARGVNGLVSVADPRQLRVLPVPLLPAPQELLPAGGTRFGVEQLKVQRSIDFGWAAVAEADGYIITLYEQADGRRRQIMQTAPQKGTEWTLGDLSVLERGVIAWQVEAVKLGRNSSIAQHGAPAESTFVIDIPIPSVHVNRPGVLYGSE